MKIQNHIKFLFENNLKKFEIDAYEIFSNIIIYLFFIAFIAYKNKEINLICSLFPYNEKVISNALTITAIAMCCIYLTLKSIKNFTVKKFVFYKSLGFKSLDIWILKCCNIFIDALICTAFLTAFIVSPPATAQVHYFILYYLLLAVCMIIFPVALSWLYNPAKTNSRNSNKNTVIINRLCFNNKYTAYLYKDISRIKSNSDFVIIFLLNMLILSFTTFHGKGIHIVLFVFISYFVSATFSAATFNFYLIELNDYLLFALSGMNKRRLFFHKLFNLCVVVWLLPVIYYTVNVAIGNIAFTPSIVPFVCVIINSFAAILSNNLAVIQYFPNEAAVKYRSFRFALVSLIPVIPLILSIILLKKAQNKNLLKSRKGEL